MGKKANMSQKIFNAMVAKPNDPFMPGPKSLYILPSRVNPELKATANKKDKKEAFQRAIAGAMSKEAYAAKYGNDK